MSVAEEPYDLDLDHRSAYFRENVYGIYDEWRAKCPVAHSSAHDGFWFLLSYEAAYDALHDHELFAADDMQKHVPLSQYPIPIIPGDTDPPELFAYRTMLMPWFSPKASEACRPMIRELTNELIDEIIERGEADVVGDVTTPLPARTILRVLGFSESNWRDWQGWIHSVVHDRVHRPETAMASYQQVHSHVMAEVAKRREHGLTDDLMSGILRGPKDGPELTEDQMFGTAFLMLLGGMDTTSGLTGNALVRLAERPELRQRLIDEPGLLDAATEEFLRHDTPAQGLPRRVTRDVEFHGRHLRKGDRVLCMYASANRDPAVFERPDEIDFDRKGNRHMTFSVGPHRCIGSNIARVMFQVLLSEILRRLPDYEIAGPYELFEDAGDVYAVRRLPIRFTPGLPAQREKSLSGIRAK